MIGYLIGVFLLGMVFGAFVLAALIGDGCRDRLKEGDEAGLRQAFMDYVDDLKIDLGLMTEKERYARP